MLTCHKNFVDLTVWRWTCTKLNVRVSSERERESEMGDRASSHRRAGPEGSGGGAAHTGCLFFVNRRRLSVCGSTEIWRRSLMLQEANRPFCGRTSSRHSAGLKRSTRGQNSTFKSTKPFREPGPSPLPVCPYMVLFPLRCCEPSTRSLSLSVTQQQLALCCRTA